MNFDEVGAIQTKGGQTTQPWLNKVRRDRQPPQQQQPPPMPQDRHREDHNSPCISNGGKPLAIIQSTCHRVMVAIRQK